MSKSVDKKTRVDLILATNAIKKKAPSVEFVAFLSHYFLRSGNISPHVLHLPRVVISEERMGS